MVGAKASQDSGITNALAEVFIRRIVGEATELVLHRLGKCGVGDDRVLCFFVCEIRVKVSDVKDGFLVSKASVLL